MSGSPALDSPLIASWYQSYAKGPLTPEELDRYFREGFLLKEDLIPVNDLQPSIAAVACQVGDLANWLFAEGKITDKCEDAGFYKRLALLKKQFPSLSVLLHRQGKLPVEAQKSWTHPALLAASRQLLGKDVSGHPAWNLRTKTPREAEGEVPWHQDSAYSDPDGDSTHILTAWISLIDATIKNGCMQVVKGGHKTGKVAPHTDCAGQTWHIEAVTESFPSVLGVDLATDLVTCEMRMGSVLFLNNLIPHRSLPNVSEDTRWSFDFRFHRTSLPSGYAMKPSIPFLLANQPDWVVKWGGWAELDRTNLQTSGIADDPFESRIVGAWMDRWPLTNENRHTNLWLELKEKGNEQKRQAMSVKY